jgi:hypothetical protein
MSETSDDKDEQPMLTPGWVAVSDLRSKQKYYWHKASKTTSWIPPPPLLPEQVQENKSSRATEAASKQPENIGIFFPHVPPAIPPQDDMIFNPIFMGVDDEDEEEESPKQTAVQLNWVVDGNNLLKSANGIKGVEEKCQEIGLLHRR